LDSQIETIRKKQGIGSENLAKNYTKNPHSKKHNHNKQFSKFERVEKKLSLITKETYELNVSA